MNYENVSTPEELLRFLDENVQYGFVSPDGKVYTNEDAESFEYGCKNVWRVQNVQTIIKGGYGHCYDQVEIERDWFMHHGYEVHTFYILFYLENIDHPYTTHTYAVFKRDGKYCLFEHSDGANKGIYEFATLKDAIYEQMKWHLKLNNSIEHLTKDVIESLHVYEYAKLPCGLDMYEFTDFILADGTEVL